MQVFDGRFLLIRVSLLCFLMITPLLEAAPKIKQFFPDRAVLLGEPLIWSVRLQYPVFETYRLSVPPCAGLELKIQDPSVSEMNGEITSFYKIRITAVSLTVPNVPSILITDQRGQGTVISGKPVTVESISGDSTQIRTARFSPRLPPQPKRTWLLYSLLLLLPLLAWATARRIREKSPKRVLLRNLQRARSDIQKGKLPSPVWRLLRSELLWGFPAETCTPSQLKTLAGDHPQFSVIAESLVLLEAWRYSGSGRAWDQARTLQCIESAIEIAGGKIPRLAAPQLQEIRQ